MTLALAITFLDLTPKATTTKAKISKWNYTKTINKKLLSAKQRRLPTN